MSPLDQMKIMAARESAVANLGWRKTERRSLSDRLVPYVGSGLTMEAVAHELDCTPAGVCKALQRMGKSL